MRRKGSIAGLQKNDHGVALIIVLLVTALLIALIFEFAYGTRISLRAAVNFRDSERAYYLARSGVNLAGLLLSDDLKNGRLQTDLERVVDTVPLMTAPADTVLKVGWEDEGGKINITNVLQNNPTYNQLVRLFTIKEIDQKILNQIADWQLHEIRKFYLLTELHQFMSDVDFSKIQDDVTLAPVTTIDINTASADVLQSIGLEAGMAAQIVERRTTEPFTTAQQISSLLGQANTMAAGQLTTTSDVFKITSLATVGGYTKQVEAIIRRRSDGTGSDVLYWRAL
jgi:type II secretory pathway component PulK